MLTCYILMHLALLPTRKDSPAILQSVRPSALKVLGCASVTLGYMCMHMWCESPKREWQTLRRGPGLIRIQAHSVGLRLGDNCCSEEWIAWEPSSSTGASHQAVHHMGLTTDILCGETKAISSLCAQLMHQHMDLTYT